MIYFYPVLFLHNFIKSNFEMLTVKNICRFKLRSSNFSYLPDPSLQTYDKIFQGCNILKPLRSVSQLQTVSLAGPAWCANTRTTRLIMKHCKHEQRTHWHGLCDSSMCLLCNFANRMHSDQKKLSTFVLNYVQNYNPSNKLQLQILIPSRELS